MTRFENLGAVMIKIEKCNIIQDEKGAFFVFGPLWFVILVMIVGFIATSMKNNNGKNNPEKVYDYNPNNIVNPLKSSTLCPKCGQNNGESAKFCNNCGSNLLPKNKSCSKCGSINQTNANFCQDCGNRFE